MRTTNTSRTAIARLSAEQASRRAWERRPTDWTFCTDRKGLVRDMRATDREEELSRGRRRWTVEQALAFLSHYRVG